jgi:hypothetical protein
MNLGETNVFEPVGSKKTFFSHVFSTTEDGKAEIMNVTQYSLLGVIPIVLLNKLIQRFIPEADADKSTIEILVEVLIQLIVMFVGVIIIHRVITYIPTYSEFKYESLTLTNVILAFLILVLSIQTKIGIKVNILVDRVMELWNGSNPRDNVMKKGGPDKKMIFKESFEQQNQQQLQNEVVFPQAPISTSRQNAGSDEMMRGSPVAPSFNQGPMAANSAFGGGSFGSSF